MTLESSIVVIGWMVYQYGILCNQDGDLDIILWTSSSTQELLRSSIVGDWRGIYNKFSIWLTSVRDQEHNTRIGHAFYSQVSTDQIGIYTLQDSCEQIGKLTLNQSWPSC